MFVIYTTIVKKTDIGVPEEIIDMYNFIQILGTVYFSHKM